MNSSKPLKDCIICCTSISIEKRTEIFSKAAKLGAICKSDLTRDVTHLIAGDFDTPKYKFAARVRSDLAFLKDSWIPDLYNSWLTGEEIDPTHWQLEYTLPALFSTRVCITNIDQPERSRIEQAVVRNGGFFSPDLTRDITHLIAGNMTGRKYEFALKWNIKVVRQEWLWDSIRRGAVLDADFYSMDVPDDQVGVGAYPTAIHATHVAQKRTIGNTTREAEAEEDIVLTKKRRKGIKDGLWDHLSRTTSFRTEEDESNENDLFVENEPEMVDQEVDLQFEKNVPKKLFHGLFFYAHGFDEGKRSRLYRCLLMNDGTIMDTPERLSTYVIVPHDMYIDDVPTLPNKIVNEWWIEKCLFHKRVYKPEEYPLAQPFMKSSLKSSFSELALHFSGFKGIDVVHLRKLVELLGARYFEYFGAQRSLLVVNTFESFGSKTLLKMNHAVKWQVRVVGIPWLWEVLKRGTFIPDVASWALDKKGDQKIKRFQDPNKKDRRVSNPGSIFELDPSKGNTQDTPNKSLDFSDIQNPRRSLKSQTIRVVHKEEPLKRSKTAPTQFGDVSIFHEEMSLHSEPGTPQDEVSYIDPQAHKIKQHLLKELNRDSTDEALPLSATPIMDENNESLLVTEKRRSLRGSR
ncbi:BRCT domain-containing protein Rad4 [Schizosaccharomyces japonicus yFS275]|uniref:BRCT domain-containing protein Rad4 n=1 Tax=Schizosaccharomyces japonicus (strain yFS275 / FY16936) TaxID=402676 RepID=B6JZQ3_SCHJY|nr:BRCT domain-containing protein Rad4 [Schizosaccharomyces japonicus yFS275]EEB07021.1 BRCT domain-containing protein Rad4 [Schizosaccharomyces japonicus yFS275]